jgi:hypothetical protein
METVEGAVRGGEAVTRCPRCWNPLQVVATTSGGTNQFCTTCHRCWRPEFGYLVEVNIYVCAGCDDPSRCRSR